MVALNNFMQRRILNGFILWREYNGANCDLLLSPQFCSGGNRCMGLPTTRFLTKMGKSPWLKREGTISTPKLPFAPSLLHMLRSACTCIWTCRPSWTSCSWKEWEPMETLKICVACSRFISGEPSSSGKATWCLSVWRTPLEWITIMETRTLACLSSPRRSPEAVALLNKTVSPFDIYSPLHLLLYFPCCLYILFYLLIKGWVWFLRTGMHCWWYPWPKPTHTTVVSEQLYDSV